MPTGLEIYKLLPKTNCKKCSFPTCLAFAMAMAAQKVELAACPDVSDEARQKLSASSRPPVHSFAIGPASTPLMLGGETVLFRHDKRFINACGLAVSVAADDPLDEVRRRCREISRLKFERVGETTGVDAVALRSTGGNPGQFALAARAVAESDALALILQTPDLDEVRAALPCCRHIRPLLHGGRGIDLKEWGNLAHETALPLVVSGASLEEISEKTTTLERAGVRDLVIDPAGDCKDGEMVEMLTACRRLAIARGCSELGYPILVQLTASTPEKRLAQAVAAVSKYASLLVLDECDPELVFPLVTLRFNLYTDPQKPIMMTPGVYEIGNPGPEAPVLVTTNFALTYYSVRPEVEAARAPARILLTDSDGMSVLTAWAADKFSASTIAKALKESNVEALVNHRTMIIPGLVSVLSGEVEESTGWRVLVGPREASGLPRFLKQCWR